VAASDVYPTVQKEVARIAALPEVRSGGEWFRSQESRFAEYQMEVARIAAPPFGEGTRGAWLAERFREIGLKDVEIDYRKQFSELSEIPLKTPLLYWIAASWVGNWTCASFSVNV